MDPKIGCFKSPARVFLRSENRLEDDEAQKRRRILVKTQLVRRLRISLSDWHKKRSRVERRTTARESTIALLRKARSQSAANDFDDAGEQAVDPITREPVSSASTYVFSFRRGSSIARVDASALIDYILTTGDYADPESRVPFDDLSLRRLDEIGAKMGKQSVLKARSELIARHADRQFLRDAVCGLERVCGESVTQMFELVECVTEKTLSADEAQMQLLTSIVPEFQSNFEQLVEADRDTARDAAEQFDAFLRGPPNKPIKCTPMHVMTMALFRSAVKDSFEAVSA